MDSDLILAQSPVPLSSGMEEVTVSPEVLNIPARWSSAVQLQTCLEGKTDIFMKTRRRQQLSWAALSIYFYFPLCYIQQKLLLCPVLTY